MEPVRNHRNKAVVNAARLHRARARRDTGKTLLEGPDVVEDAVAAGCRIKAIFATSDDTRARALSTAIDAELMLVDERALKRVAGTDTPRGPVAIVDIPPERLDHDRDLLVSWGVSDPGNVGTLIRTAASFGWGYAYVPGSADPWSPKTLRAGAGGQFQTGVISISGLDQLQDWTTVATVARNGVEPESVSGDRFAVLIGPESAGLPPEVVDRCAHRVTIATPGVTESLNAAVAAGIVLYAISGKRSGL